MTLKAGQTRTKKLPDGTEVKVTLTGNGSGEPGAAHPAPVKPFPTSYTRARWKQLTPSQRANANRLMTAEGMTVSRAISAVRKSTPGKGR